MTYLASLSVWLGVIGAATPAAAFGDVWGGGHWQKRSADASSSPFESASRLDDARSLFESIRSLNLRSPDAEAKLQRLGLENDEIRKGINDYERAKSEDAYFEQLGSTPGDMFTRLRSQGLVTDYLVQAVARNAPFAVVHSYFLSFLLGNQGMAEEAGYFFNKAEFMQRLAAEQTRSPLDRPLQYEFPRLYEQFGMPWYTPRQLRVLRFVDDEMLKGQRFAIENELDTGRWHAHAAAYARYDTDVVGRTSEGSLPEGIRKATGTASRVFLNIGRQTSPVRDLNAGLDVYATVDGYVREDLKGYNRLTFLPGAYASFWNSTDNEIRARYDYGFQFERQVPLKRNREVHGPQLTWAHLWNRRYQAVAEYSYKRSRYPGDASYGPGALSALSGSEHSASLKVAYPGGNRMVQPFMRYRFEHLWPNGGNFKSNVHTVEAGTVYLIGPQVTLNFTTLFGMAFYPMHERKRRDQLRQARLGLAYSVYGLLNVLLDISYSDTISTVAHQYSSKRWNLSLGPSVGMNF